MSFLRFLPYDSISQLMIATFELFSHYLQGKLFTANPYREGIVANWSTLCLRATCLAKWTATITISNDVLWWLCCAFVSWPVAASRNSLHLYRWARAFESKTETEMMMVSCVGQGTAVETSPSRGPGTPPQGRGGRECGCVKRECNPC